MYRSQSDEVVYKRERLGTTPSLIQFTHCKPLVACWMKKWGSNICILKMDLKDYGLAKFSAPPQTDNTWDWIQRAKKDLLQVHSIKKHDIWSLTRGIYIFQFLLWSGVTV